MRSGLGDRLCWLMKKRGLASSVCDGRNKEDETTLIVVKMSKTEEIIRRYQLVKFIDDDKNDAALLSIDRVPRRWIRYDIDTGETVTKFPPPPYDCKQKQAALEQLIISEGDPWPEWPEYPVNLVGHADTYKDSLARLVTLESKPYAYTSESDTAAKQKSSKIIEELKKQSLAQIMEVTQIEDDRSDDSEYVDNPQSSSGSDDRPARPLSKKTSKVKVKGKKSAKTKKVFVSGSEDSDSPGSKKLTKTLSKVEKKKRKDRNALKDEIVDSDFSRSNKSKASKSSATTNSEESQSVPQLQRETKKKEEKKEAFKPKSSESDSSRSIKSKASKSSKSGTAFEKSAVSMQRRQNISSATSSWITSKNSRDSALPLAETSGTAGDFLNIEHHADVTDNILSEGSYSVQESGELYKLVDEKQEVLYDDTQQFPRDKIDKADVLKPHNFAESLSKAFNTVEKAGTSYAEDTLVILSAIKGLSVDLKENTNAINYLCATVRNSKVSVVTDSEAKALVLGNDFDLPFKTLEDFKIFDNQLKDTKYREQCAASLLFYVDRDNHVTKSVTNILRKFVGREVCMNFTAVKQIGEKEVFKNTRFCNIMFEVITTNHKDNKGEVITEKYFYHCIGQTIANAKDWDGARMERAKKEKARREETVMKGKAGENGADE